MSVGGGGVANFVYTTNAIAKGVAAVISAGSSVVADVFDVEWQLFSDGEQGFWYDFSDSSTLFQDAAGTTPVTAAGYPVGLVLDGSRGLVPGAEEIANGTFDSDTAWTDADTGTGTSVIAGGVLTLNGTNASNRAIRQQSFTTVVGTTYRIQSTINGTGLAVAAQTSGTLGVGILAIIAQSTPSAYFTATTTTTFINIFTSPSGSGTVDNVTVKSIAGNHAVQTVSANRPLWGRWPESAVIAGFVRNLLINTATLSTQSRTVTAVAHTLSFKGTGTVTLSGASTAGPLVGTGAEDFVFLTFTPSAASLTLTVTGTVQSAQLEIGATRTTAQIVGASSAYDVTEAGQPTKYFLYFNGVNYAMQTAASVDFSSTDEMSVFAGVTKLSDAASGTVVALTSLGGSTNGSFNLLAPSASGDNSYRYQTRGTVVDVAGTGVFAPAPESATLTGLSDISTPIATIRRNGSVVETAANTQGTGTYANAISYLGSQGGVSTYFTGNLYQLITRGKLTDGTLLNRTEQFVATKVKGSL